MEHPDLLERAARWAGVNLTAAMDQRLRAFENWLRAEAIPAGGLGPGESDRLVGRHLADSLTFAAGWRSACPKAILDVGSGVGLPAIPLAITHPDTMVTALDRSGRRIRLMRRALRILELENVHPLQLDVSALERSFPAVVSRASIPPERLRSELERLVAPGGVAVVAASRLQPAEYPGFNSVEIPVEVLDRTAWILMMGRP